MKVKDLKTILSTLQNVNDYKVIVFKNTIDSNDLTGYEVNTEEKTVTLHFYHRENKNVRN